MAFKEQLQTKEKYHIFKEIRRIEKQNLDRTSTHKKSQFQVNF